MTINELSKFTAFQEARFTVINLDNPELAVSIDDEIVDITAVKTVDDTIKNEIMVFPIKYLSVHCVVKKP